MKDGVIKISKTSIYKCCYNCRYGSEYAEPNKEFTTVPNINANSSVIEYAEKCKNFNNTKRFCSNKHKEKVYLMYEKRYCKGFEPDELINEYYKPEKEK